MVKHQKVSKYYENDCWLSPVVAVNKDEKNVRICIDIRYANKTIQPTRYPVPKLDDLFIKLKAGKHFTKLELRSAFHQLGLDEELTKARLSSIS